MWARTMLGPPLAACPRADPAPLAEPDSQKESGQSTALIFNRVSLDSRFGGSWSPALSARALITGEP